MIGKKNLYQHDMSRISKILLISSTSFFSLGFIIHQVRLWNMQSQLDGASEGWANVVVHLYATGWDIWDDIIVYSILAAFACTFCAILLRKRDSPYEYQKLFPE